MPKMKTHRGAAKRFKATGSGKIVRNRAGKRHLLTGHSKKCKRQLRSAVVVDKTNAEALRRLLPYL